MKKTKIEITSDDVDYALGASPWDVSNKILYCLCQRYPKHETDQAIIAKILLIGRTYAAAIERRKNAQETSDHFYEAIVAEKIRKSNIDNWLSSLPNQILDLCQELGAVITVYKRVMDIFFNLTGLEKQALTSKYLHFYKPNLFFINDSRAKQAIFKITPRLNYIGNIAANESESEYHDFCRRCQYLQNHVNDRIGKTLTPRQIDEVLFINYREN